MPESPEVQALVEFVGERAVGRAIAGFEVLDYPEYKTRGVPPASLDGCRIEAVSRHGKYVDVQAADRHLVISFGRGGWFRWHDAEADVGDAEIAAPVVATVALSDGAAFDIVDGGAFRSVGIWVVDRAEQVAAIGKLGPDPLDPFFSRESFDRVVVGRRKQLKAVLQEQASFAGIGNAYSDEILFVARLSPVVHAAELSSDDRDRLYEAMRTVLRDAVDARRGIRPDRLKQAKVDAMLVHGRGGQPCPNGNGTVLDFTFAGASAQYCPPCQTAGVIL